MIFCIQICKIKIVCLIYSRAKMMAIVAQDGVLKTYVPVKYFVMFKNRVDSKRKRE